ncbi:MAG: hypothetical protein HRT47_12675 [Candidatus Caenarcaniphilales bacterium]|nr:hypothetical protein [Candidatus Caenarcaniphilales bacterium]
MDPSLERLKEASFFFEKLASLSEIELKNFVFSWHKEGESVSDLITFIEFLRAKHPPLRLKSEAYDCAGTGGDKADTFNISTSSAIVAAALGLPILKNGGRSATSKTGSVDFLEELGVNFDLSDEDKIAKFYNYGLSFISSPVSAEYLAPVKKISKAKKKSSFINLIAPFLSPIELNAQLIGVAHKKWIPIVLDIAKYFIEKGYRKRIILVHAASPENKEKVLDEAASIWPFKTYFLDREHTIEHSFLPSGLGMRSGDLPDLRGGDTKENVAILKKLIKAEIPQGDYTEWSAMQSKFETLLLNSALLFALREDFSKFSKFAQFLTFYKLKIGEIKTKLDGETVSAFLEEYLER